MKKEQEQKGEKTSKDSKASFLPKFASKLAWFEKEGRKREREKEKEREKKSRRSRVDGLLTPAGCKSATPDNRQLQRDESRSTINDHYNYYEETRSHALSIG